MSLIQEKIHSLLEPTVEDLGYILWGVEFINSKQPTLRIFIDKYDTGVTIEDCSIASRAISAILDVEDPIEPNYTLEVSSPGVNRLLFNPKQFQIFEGFNVSLHLRMPLFNRRKWFGKIVSVTENSVTIDTSVTKDTNKKPKSTKQNSKQELEHDALVEFLFSNILKANLEPDF